MKYELMRNNLRHYGIEVNQTFILKARKAYRRVCNHNSADLNQFTAIMRRLGCPDVYSNERIFQCFDEDGSGRIDSEEFCIGLIAAMDTPLKDKLLTYFFLVDSNGDGMLDQEEVEDMLVTSGKYEADDIKGIVDGIFKELERDEGFPAMQSIALEEFMSAVSRNQRILGIFEHCFA